jgi:mRNA interferase RelE/StbE
VKSRFRKSFTRDLKKLKDPTVMKRVKVVIEELETARHLGELTNVKKVSGSGNFYRVRVGDYRLGIALEGDTVEFVRCLHRRDIYRYFP